MRGVAVLAVAIGAAAWFGFVSRGPDGEEAGAGPRRAGGTPEAAGRRPAPTPPGGVPLHEREAIDRGLDWLASAQESDGRWSCKRWNPFIAERDRGRRNLPGFGPLTEEGLDPAVTGLALMPFLFDGQTRAAGRHSATVGRALQYLRMMGTSFLEHGDPRPAGGQCHCHGPGQSVAEEFDTVVVFAALAEAFRRTDDESLRRLVEQGVEKFTRERRRDRPWAHALSIYDIGPVPFWVQLLESAEAVGIAIPRYTRGEAEAYLRELTDPQTGRIVNRDVCPECLGGWDAQAAAVLLRGWVSDFKSPVREAQLDTIASHPPAWETTWRLPMDPSKGRPEAWLYPHDIVNYYFWYYGTLALQRHGGEARCGPWRTALVDVLSRHQIREGELAGSWEPVDPWGRVGGRVYSTAYSIMALQVPYTPSPRRN